MQTGFARAQMAAGRLVPLRTLGTIGVLATGSIVVWKIADAAGVGGFVYKKITGENYTPAAGAETYKWVWTASGSDRNWTYSTTGQARWVASSNLNAREYCWPDQGYFTSQHNNSMHGLSGTEFLTNAAGGSSCISAGRTMLKFRTEAQMLATVKVQPSTAAEFASPPSGATTVTAGTDDATALTDADLDAAIQELGANDTTDRRTSDPPAEQTIDWINTQLDPTYSADTGTMPNCSALSYSACVSAFAAAGFTSTPTRTTLSFTGADVTKPADAVVSTSIAYAAVVPLTQPLIITANPSPASMPLVLPELLPHETAQAYRDRLTALGVLGAVTIDVLSDVATDPAFGPDALVRASPSPGTRVLPGTAVRIVANPSTAPDPATDVPPAADSRCGPAIPPLDFGPLSVPTLGDKFPFGVFTWMADTLGGWTGGEAFAPDFTFPMPGDIPDLHADLQPFADPIMAVVRPVMLVVAVLGLMWLFATSAMGFGAGARD